jgi:hypothetical protein
MQFGRASGLRIADAFEHHWADTANCPRSLWKMMLSCDESTMRNRPHAASVLDAVGSLSHVLCRAHSIEFGVLMTQ